MMVSLTDEEATLICALIEDEQNCCGYEQYWDRGQRKLFDDIIFKIKCGFRMDTMQRIYPKEEIK